jgi:hypothetical protein
MRELENKDAPQCEKVLKTTGQSLNRVVIDFSPPR